MVSPSSSSSSSSSFSLFLLGASKCDRWDVRRTGERLVKEHEKALLDHSRHSRPSSASYVSDTEIRSTLSPHRYHLVHIIRQFSHPRRAARHATLTRVAKGLSFLNTTCIRGAFPVKQKVTSPSRARGKSKRHPINKLCFRFYLRAYSERYFPTALPEHAIPFLWTVNRHYVKLDIAKNLWCNFLYLLTAIAATESSYTDKSQRAIPLSLSLSQRRILRRDSQTRKVHLRLILSRSAGRFFCRRLAPFSRETELRSDAS